MLKNLRRVAILTVWLALVAGCQALTGQTLGENIDDTTITTSVKTNLAAETVGSLTRVGVDTVQGVVTLTGVVASSEERARAEEVARKVKGVKGVKNNLQVQKG
jgi:hyperosmotically inducible periplasmic protein